ncbi:uncharacterized protein EKO05_0010233 [Ascochyta rabiei]|uniref:Carboxylic ester hydrolase n=1 Tax=Didymella rabiei TaxID=5454 RepID=A0A162WLB9_DIDRA|nr:uncharacterized protein EKO05_0010233 [Ascochyta rabiei]KZM19098.1 hydrolase [Ascochyta rabiei]UPX19985.1 hypothetical protein EKO05_0010233 [Ascochyta rabiei]
MWSSFVALLALSVNALAAPSKTSTVARVKNGTIEGVHSPSYNQDFFLGVPFAQPPLGDLRFRQAQSLNTTWEGTRDAKEYATHCVGYGLDQTFYKASEDCLYLNVVRPSGYDNKKLPVAFWIHGGTFTNGGAADQRYNLSFIVEQSVKIGKPIIGVSINYRLSLWGFTSSNELASEGLLNIGLKDQRLALHWVQENIEAFGGDPKKVTIFGESAGAASIGFHLTAYRGRDDHLFRAAILQSGNPIFYNAQRGANATQSAFNTVVSQVGCASSSNKIQCLRDTPFSALNATMNGTLSSTGGFAPVTDGDLVQDYGSSQLSRGEFVKVPIITGTNSDEGASFAPYGINTTAQFQAALTASNLPLTLQTSLLAAYPDDLSTNVIAALGNQRPAASFGYQFRRVATYIGDQLFIAPRRQTAKSWAQHEVPAYAYRFNADQAGFAPELAISHFKEIGFVFYNLAGVGFRPDIKPFEGKPERYAQLSAFVCRSWISFVHDLDPNAWPGRDGVVPLWPQYSVEDPSDFVFEVNATSHVEADTWRGEGIEIINQNALAVFSR